MHKQKQNKKSQRQKQNLTQFTACGNNDDVHNMHRSGRVRTGPQHTLVNGP